MTHSFGEWSDLVRLRPHRNAHTPAPVDEQQFDAMMRLYIERALDDLRLTSAQRAVALRRLAGESVASIAVSRGTEQSTVRAQFTPIFLKANADDYEEFSSSIWKRAFAALAAHLELLLLG